MDTIPDRVSFDLIMELVEMQVGPNPGFDLTALALGCAAGTLQRYKERGYVPRDRAEWLYDRLARGIGPKKTKLDPWSYPMDYDERATLARQAQTDRMARLRRVS